MLRLTFEISAVFVLSKKKFHNSKKCCIFIKAFLHILHQNNLTSRGMKNSAIIVAFIVVLVAFPVLKAESQITITAQVFAEVIPALTATETSQLNFGRFSPETQGGTVMVTPDGARTATGTVELSGGTHNPASFYVTGEGSATFSIILPAGPAILTNTGSSKTMQVSNWVSNPPQGIGAGLLTRGSQEIKIGASLIVGPLEANPVGLYSGTYAITFGYN
jgi:Domain of unknown function (DUF4402)